MREKIYLGEYSLSRFLESGFHSALFMIDDDIDEETAKGFPGIIMPAESGLMLAIAAADASLSEFEKLYEALGDALMLINREIIIPAEGFPVFRRMVNRILTIRLTEKTGLYWTDGTEAEMPPSQILRLDDFCRIVRKGSRAFLRRWISSTMSEVKASGSWTYFRACIQLIGAAFNSTASLFRAAGIDTGRWYSELMSSASYDDMEAKLKELAEVLPRKGERKPELEYIEEHYREVSFGSSDVASYIGKSLNYTRVMFKKQHGVSISRYITTLRMDYAKRLLTDTDKGIKEIAQLSGFPNPSSFCTLFLKETGVSPSVYRKNPH